MSLSCRARGRGDPGFLRKHFRHDGPGGDNNFGTVFEVARSTFKRVYSFCVQSGCADGGYPYGTLIFDSRGRIVGTTQYGGTRSLGEVYRLKP